MKKFFISYFNWLHGKFPAGTVEPFPESKEDGSTSVPGVYVTGDLTGIPLLKFALETGTRVVQTIASDPSFVTSRANKPAHVHPLVIVGAGVSGMAAASAARDLGIEALVLEAHQAFATISDFPKGKPIFTYPMSMTPLGSIEINATDKETLLSSLHKQTEHIAVTAGHVVGIQKKSGWLDCELDDGTHVQALRVILAIGRSGHFRKLDVPGESADRVYHRLHDPTDFAGRHVLVVGGGDSALETACALLQAGALVTMSYRQPSFSKPKPELLRALEAWQHGATIPRTGGKLTLLLGSSVKSIEPNCVVLDKQGASIRIENEVVFAMIGREAPLDLFKKAGIPIRGKWTLSRLVACLLFVVLCAAIYNWKSGGILSDWARSYHLFPYSIQYAAYSNQPVSAALATCSFFPGCVENSASLLGTLAISAAQPGFWYTLAYTAIVVIFGIRRIRRRKTPYVTKQTIALMLVQLLPLFVLPEIVLPLLGKNGLIPQLVENALFPLVSYGHGREYWRAYGFVLAWPLFIYNVFTSQPLWAWLGISLVQTFVLLPLVIYRYGKGSYCGWICSCGALAETLGDDYRQRMPHGKGTNRLQMVGQGILAVCLLLLVLRMAGWIWPQLGIDRFFSMWVEGNNNTAAALSYKWLVDVGLAGVMGMGLYFWFSGRVWCRFFCPLAALMHVYTRFSRFRIFAEKKKCIACNVCTSVCHMGVDVMSRAVQGLPVEDPECVRCSACVQSCPTDVLQFGQLRTGTQTHTYDKTSARLVQIRKPTRAIAPAT